MLPLLKYRIFFFGGGVFIGAPSIIISILLYSKVTRQTIHHHHTLFFRPGWFWILSRAVSVFVVFSFSLLSPFFIWCIRLSWMSAFSAHY